MALRINHPGSYRAVRCPKWRTADAPRTCSPKPPSAFARSCESSAAWVGCRVWREDHQVSQPYCLSSDPREIPERSVHFEVFLRLVMIASSKAGVGAFRFAPVITLPSGPNSTRYTEPLKGTHKWTVRAWDHGAQCVEGYAMPSTRVGDGRCLSQWAMIATSLRKRAETPPDLEEPGQSEALWVQG